MATLSARGEDVKGTMAILGDSISSGAVINPRIKFETQSLWSVFSGEDEIEDLRRKMQEPDFWVTQYPMPEPVVLEATGREFQSSAVWFAERLIQLASRQFLNNPEYAWPNLLGRRLGYSSEKILIAADNGAKSKDIVNQIARVLHHTDKKIPTKTFVFYTGNDICSPFLQLMTGVQQYEALISRGLDYLFKHGDTDANERYEINLVGMIDITQLYRSEAILGKKVQAHGKQRTCEDLMNNPPESWTVSQPAASSNAFDQPFLFNVLPFPKNQASYCPSLFGTAYDMGDKKDDSYKSLIANRIRDYREALKKIALAKQRELETKGMKNITVRYIDSLFDIKFASDEIAEDCFHLSVKGHERIARELFQSL